jgi:serine protease Do
MVDGCPFRMNNVLRVRMEPGMVTLRRLFLAIGLGVGSALSVLPAYPAPADQPPGAIAGMIASVQGSVMRVVVVHPPEQPDDNGQGKSQAGDSKPVTRIGSGFVIDPSGLVATNRHVVENTLAIFVGTPDGGRYRAEVVGMPARADIALLRIVHPPAHLTAVKFGDSDKLRPGDTVIAIGSPFGFDNTVTAGIVSSVNRDIMESPFDDYIQTDAAINHGNSGGPLFNTAGEVIGMTSVLYAPGNYSGSVGVGFAIPSNDLRFVFSRLERYGQVRAGMLPLRTQQVTEFMAQAIGSPDSGGALIASLGPKADEMNHQIEPGDIVRSFNGQPVIDPRDLARKAARAEIGSLATLGICRGGTIMTVQVPILPFEDLPPNGEVLPGPPPKTLGLQLAAAKGGVAVAAIDPSGSVADSGLQPGDIILRVQQQRVSAPEEAEAALKAREAAKQPYAAILVERDDKSSWIPIALPGE